MVGDVPEIAEFERAAEIRGGTHRRRQKAGTPFDRRVGVRHERGIKYRYVFDLDKRVLVINVFVGGVVSDFARFYLPQGGWVVFADVAG